MQTEMICILIFIAVMYKMSWNKIEEHCRMMCRFFDWTKALARKQIILSRRKTAERMPFG
jgi:hypothetical protein